MEEIKKIYKESGYVGRSKLKAILDKQGIYATKEDLDNLYEKSKVAQLHKKDVKQISRPISTTNPFIAIQLDLLDMSKFHKKNKGLRWILIAIDIFTRKAYAEPLKTKSPEDVSVALADMLKKADFIPKIIESDDGTEWKGKTAEYMAKNKIAHKIGIKDDHKFLGLIDRYSQTLKNALYKHMTAEDDTEWYESLAGFVKSYNAAPHATLCNMSPDEAEKWVIDTTNCHVERIKRVTAGRKERFAIGDNVRIRGEKNKFTKGYETKWSTETYSIIYMQDGTYTLDNTKEYRASMLQKVKDVDVEPEKEKVIKVPAAKKAKTDYQKEQQHKKDELLESNIKTGLRPRAPKHLLVSDKYGAIIE